MSDERTQRYQETFCKAGGFVSPYIRAQRHPNAGGGFGVMAQQRMRSGAIVASVPAGLFLTAAVSRKMENLDRASEVPSPIAAICIHLVRQRLRLIEQLLASHDDLNSSGRDCAAANVLAPAAFAGFSLAHVDLSSVSATGDLHSDWIARLPPQYDNLIQFAPHLDWLALSTTTTTTTDHDRDENADVDDESTSARRQQAVMAAWREVARAFDGRQNSAASSSNDDDAGESSPARLIVIESLLVLGLPRRYASKASQEIMNWRRLAAQYIKFMSYTSFSASVDSSSSSSCDAPAAAVFSPRISALLDVHRANLKSLTSTSSSSTPINQAVATSAISAKVKAACALEHFSSNESALVELFGWAYASLMSRGFAHDDEVWVMQPWVDYFNYAPYNDYNVTASLNEQLGKFEFKVRSGHELRADQELTLHYGTYSDFELTCWYGFGLCRPHQRQQSQDGQEGGANEDDAHQHQPECEYVLSPLSNSDGEYSVDEFARFVSQIVMVAMTIVETEQGNNNNDEVVDVASLDRTLLSKCTSAVVKKMCRNYGCASPRCTIRRNSDFGSNTQFQQLLDDIVEYLVENNSSPSSANGLTTRKLLAKVVSLELTHGFSPSSFSSQKPTATQLLAAQMARENTTLAAQFARAIGADIRSILQRSLAVQATALE